MDWSKAKNILIVALLATNLILLGAIYVEKAEVKSSDEATLREDTVLLLKEHGIYVEEDIIPEKDQRLPVLFVKYEEGDQSIIASVLEDSDIRVAEGAGEEAYRQAADQLILLAGFYRKSMVYRSVIEEEGTVTVNYGMEYEGFSVDNSQLAVTFEDGRPVDMMRKWAEPFSMGKNKKQVMPALTALIKFMTEQETAVPEEERDDIFIEEIRLVYWLEGYEESDNVSEDTAVPYWCIHYNGDQLSYIAAYEQ